MHLLRVHPCHLRQSHQPERNNVFQENFQCCVPVRGKMRSTLLGPESGKKEQSGQSCKDRSVSAFAKAFFAHAYHLRKAELILFFKDAHSRAAVSSPFQQVGLLIFLGVVLLFRQVFF